MDTRTVTLTEFLLARIGEDEALEPHEALCAFVTDIDQDVGPYAPAPCTCGLPARFAADCEAKRRIVEYGHRAALEPGSESMVGYQAAISDTLRALALPYADHPDYDEAWRP